MELLRPLFQALPTLLPALGVLAVVSVGLLFGHRLLLGRGKQIGAEARLPRQIALLALGAMALVAVILVLPMDIQTRGQVLSLLGLVVTAVIALSSTTFVSNAMAGLMLRTIKSFRPGDYIRIGEWFGRVTERGLVHTEIQSEDRDLVTLPNLYLVTNPVKVVRKSGTVISVRLSLAYDAPRARVESALKAAALEVGLADAFVHVKELGNFSVDYMIAGFLDDIDRLLTTRSRLRKAVLDQLHGDGIEIVSPTFMNTRAFDPREPVLPDPSPTVAEPVTEHGSTAEDVVFDKASQAAELDELQAGLATLTASRKDGTKRTSAEIADLDRRQEELNARIERLSDDIEGQ